MGEANRGRPWVCFAARGTRNTGSLSGAANQPGIGGVSKKKPPGRNPEATSLPVGSLALKDRASIAGAGGQIKSSDEPYSAHLHALTRGGRRRVPRTFARGVFDSECKLLPSVLVAVTYSVPI